jgi:exopolysaccharide production protein ExoZ
VTGNTINSFGGNTESTSEDAAGVRALKSLLSIQYLRAFAVLAVVLSHAVPLATLGQAGVDVFFVVSGFIMWSSTNRPTPPALFLWHRLIRIVPLYWVATLLMAHHQDAPIQAVAKSLMFIPYFGEGGHIWPILVAGWTLTYEMLFYVLMGVVLTMPRRIGLPGLAGTLCLLAAANVLVPLADPVLLTVTNPLILEFLAGVALAELRFRVRLPGQGGALLLAAGAILAFWLPRTSHALPGVWRFAWWGLPSGMLVMAAVSLEDAGKIMRFAPMLAIGDASYSIYLFHPFILKTAENAFAVYPFLLRCAAAVVACTALGLFAYYVVERPMTKRLRRIPFRGTVAGTSLMSLWRKAPWLRNARAVRSSSQAASIHQRDTVRACRVLETRGPRETTYPTQPPRRGARRTVRVAASPQPGRHDHPHGHSQADPCGHAQFLPALHAGGRCVRDHSRQELNRRKGRRR